MKTNIETELQKIRRIRLSEAEKHSMLRTLVENQAQLEVPEFLLVSASREKRFVWLQDVWANVVEWSAFISAKNIYSIPLALAFLFLLGASTSFAAEGTLPGDALYPVKIHVNENVESTFSFGSKAMAETEAKHALKRLAEAEQLASVGKLDATTTEQIHQNFTQEVAAIRLHLDALKQKGDVREAAEVSTHFKGKLHDHGSAFGILSDAASTTNPGIIKIHQSIEDEINDTQDDENERTQEATTTGLQPEYSGVRKGSDRSSQSGTAHPSSLFGGQ